MATPTITTTYTLTVMAANGCPSTNTASVTVTVNAVAGRARHLGAAVGAGRRLGRLGERRQPPGRDVDLDPLGRRHHGRADHAADRLRRRTSGHDDGLHRLRDQRRLLVARVVDATSRSTSSTCRPPTPSTVRRRRRAQRRHRRLRRRQLLRPRLGHARADGRLPPEGRARLGLRARPPARVSSPTSRARAASPSTGSSSSRSRASPAAAAAPTSAPAIPCAATRWPCSS